MAKNTGRDPRTGKLRTGSQRRETTTGLWARRNLSSGVFAEAKKSGGAFKGLRREG